MKDLIQPILDALRQGSQVVLCSILRTEGSVPRGPGAKMAVFADGSARGTVGGGALELQATCLARELLQTGGSTIRAFSLHPAASDSLGMVCGGKAELGFAVLSPTDEAALRALETLDRSVSEGRTAWLRTAYPAAGPAVLTCLKGPDAHTDVSDLPPVPTLFREETETVQLEPVRPGSRVWLFGGGHVGKALVPVLAAVDFPVTVYDERESLADSALHPMAQAVICAPYSELLNRTEIGPEDYVVVMTPGHEADFLVLSQVLRTPATYIGCIGSKRKVAFVNGRLLQEGFPEAEIARIHSPIGLPIGAVTPAEIAVSVAAEMILHRSKH